MSELSGENGRNSCFWTFCRFGRPGEIHFVPNIIFNRFFWIDFLDWFSGQKQKFTKSPKKPPAHQSSPLLNPQHIYFPIITSFQFISTPITHITALFFILTQTSQFVNSPPPPRQFSLFEWYVKLLCIITSQNWWDLVRSLLYNFSLCCVLKTPS